MRIEDYALIGDTQTAALVGSNGSIDWLCLPHFDSEACFAAILGSRSNGRWLLAPEDGDARVERRYVPGTLVLETTFHTPTGIARVIDFMPPRGDEPDVVRIVEGVSGTVSMSVELIARFDYGLTHPWVRRDGETHSFVAGPNELLLSTSVDLDNDESVVSGRFTVRSGDRVEFVLVWHPSNQPRPRPVSALRALDQTVHWWNNWSDQCRADGGRWADQVKASLVVLKALTYAPSGGIVAAPTTSLPEHIGGSRNWDYRHCWLRDATFTLQALLAAGYESEAVAWRDWLLRAVAGHPAQVQVLYGLNGERLVNEMEIEWLDGYEGSRPVRIGNAAVRQRQLDVYGETMDVLHQARLAGLQPEPDAWAMQKKMLDWLESGWREVDSGLWEMRHHPRHFVHSKVMCWVAFDRAVRACERFGLDGPVEHWRATADLIHREVCEHGWDANRRCFTQSYGSRALDASLLMIPMVGFLEPTDERVTGTIDAIRRELTVDGFVLRYPIDEVSSVDGLPGSEGTFLLCSFWLADALALTGELREAEALFDRLVALGNDVGLLSEEYDPTNKRMLGNFPQAFSHVGLVNTALNLTGAAGPAQRRMRG